MDKKIEDVLWSMALSIIPDDEGRSQYDTPEEQDEATHEAIARAIKEINRLHE